MARTKKHKREREDDDEGDKSPTKLRRSSRLTSSRYRKDTRANKNIIFNFDGTGNDEFKPGALPDRPADQDGSTALGNVAKLHLLLGGDFREDEETNFYGMENQVVCYYSGVGTDGDNAFRRLWEKAFATQDVDKIINKALEDLRKLYEKGDHVYVTGFSRGAAIARKFCAVVAQQKDLKDVEVELLICFDTVASIGKPDISTESRPSTDVLFENQRVAPNVRKAIHMVSIDDKRRHFQPTLMNKERRVTEVWFAGNHGDVGGGWIQDGLSDITLTYALEHLEEFKDSNGLQILSPDDVKYEEINEATECVSVDPQDLSIDPDPLGTSHEQEESLLSYDRLIVVVKNDEIVEDGLPLVYYTVGERIQGMDDYRPPNLKDTKHLMLNADGTTKEMNGLKDYLVDDEEEEEAPPKKRARTSTDPSSDNAKTTPSSVAVK